MSVIQHILFINSTHARAVEWPTAAGWELWKRTLLSWSSSFCFSICDLIGSHAAWVDTFCTAKSDNYSDRQWDWCDIKWKFNTNQHLLRFEIGREWLFFVCALFLVELVITNYVFALVGIKATFHVIVADGAAASRADQICDINWHQIERLCWE
jgi:hypothetical protein